MMCEWYSRSRRRIAPFSPLGAASYSATIRSLYSAENVRRFGRGAGFCSGLVVLAMREVAPVSPTQTNPRDRVSQSRLSERAPGLNTAGWDDVVDVSMTARSQVGVWTHDDEGGEIPLPNAGPEPTWWRVRIH